MSSPVPMGVPMEPSAPPPTGQPPAWESPPAGEFGAPALPLFAPGSEEVRPELVVLTGATGLMGSAMAAEATRRGHRVCLLGRDPDELDAVIASLGPTAEAAMLRADLAVAEEVVAAVEFIAHLDAPVRTLIHAAGLAMPSTVLEGPIEALDEHYLLNVRGPYLLTQRVVPLMQPAVSRVVFFSASASVGPLAHDPSAHHAIASAGAQAMAEQLRTELAPRRIGVLHARTELPPGADTAEPGFPDALARGVFDALEEPSLDVVDLVARSRK